MKKEGSDLNLNHQIFCRRVFIVAIVLNVKFDLSGFGGLAPRLHFVVAKKFPLPAA